MKRFFLLLILIGLSQSQLTAQSSAKAVALGEDLDEINCYVKNIYAIGNNIYVDIDVIQIKYRNIDERYIVNQNLKIRTYLVDKNTLIYSDDCKEISPTHLLKIKSRLLNNKEIIAVGKSENGKMLSINFGCYG